MRRMRSVWLALSVVLMSRAVAVMAQTADLPATACTATSACSQGCTLGANSPSTEEPLWFSVDYLMWWTRGAETPALVTSSAANTPRAAAGVLGQPGTSTLFGDDTLNDGLRSGIRVRGGYWFDACRTQGLDFNFFALENLASGFQQSSNGAPVLARPFIDANTGQPIAELAAYPGLIGGGIDATSVSNGMWGGGVNLRQMIAQCGSPCCGNRVDFLLGYRQLRFDDRIRVQERLTSPLFAAGTELVVTDYFATRNAFYGANLGLMHRVQRCDWRLESFFNLGLGANHSRIHINGETTVTSPGGNQVVNPGGLLALQSNSGDFDSTTFTALFDVGTNFSYRLIDDWWLRVGYTFLYWPHVFRAGDQIDPLVSPNLLPPANPQPGDSNHPVPQQHSTDFWAQGINLGIEYWY